MSDIEVSRDIAAPADDLWAMVSDVTRQAEWSPEVTGCSWVGGSTGPEVGARFKGENRNGKKSWATTCVVTECEPGKAFAFTPKALGKAYAEWGYFFEPTDGGSRVTERWTDRRGGLFKKVGGFISGVDDRAAHNRAGMEATLDALKAAAEKQP